MKSVALKIFLGFVAAAAMSVAQPQSNTGTEGDQSAKPRWSTVTIRMEHEVVKVGERTRLFIDRKNTSGQPILVGEDLKNSNVADLRYPVQVRDGKGNPAPETKWGRRVRTGKDDPGEETVQLGSYHERFVQPGETDTDGIELNGLYDLKQPGKYTAQVVKVDEKGKVVFESNIVTFTVTK